jgi:hypothetical protein
LLLAMAGIKAAPAPPSSTTQPATAVVKAAPPSAGTVSVGSATSEWLSTGSAATTAGPPAKTCTYSQGPKSPTGPTPTPNATESTPAASFAANVGSAGNATPNAETAAPNTETASAGDAAAGSDGAAHAKAEAADVPAATVLVERTLAAVSEAAETLGAVASVGSATSADGGPGSGPALDDEDDRVRLVEIRQIYPPTSTGSNVAGSAATIVDNPLFWQVGDGASPNVWWTDCSQEFAAALHQQRNAGIRRGRYFFYGHMAQGAIPFLHDFDERVQTNERTGKRKRIRLLQNVSLD